MSYFCIFRVIAVLIIRIIVRKYFYGVILEISIDIVVSR